jgi:transcriptional regulator with XRE-family HTH domain
MTPPKTAKIHLGKKIERIRMLKGMQQDTLATELGLTQGAISRMERSENVNEEKLKQVADALGVSVEAIKNFDEQAAINNLQNTFHDSSVQNQFNPIEKIVNLYERLLESEHKKVELLESMVKGKNSH